MVVTNRKEELNVIVKAKMNYLTSSWGVIKAQILSSTTQKNISGRFNEGTLNAFSFFLERKNFKSKGRSSLARSMFGEILRTLMDSAGPEAWF